MASATKVKAVDDVEGSTQGQTDDGAGLADTGGVQGNYDWRSKLATGFVPLAQLATSKQRANEYAALESLVGVPVIFAAVNAESRALGTALVYRYEDIEIETTENGSTWSAPKEKEIVVNLGRGMLKTLAAAATKANGQVIVATVVKQKKGYGLE